MNPKKKKEGKSRGKPSPHVTHIRHMAEMLLSPALGEEGGERKVVEDPALTAEYTVESTVVSIPRTRVPVETCLECKWRPLHS